MGLDFAIDELYATGWRADDADGCEQSPSGRTFPGLERVRAEFAAAGVALGLRHIQLFDCCCAEWRDGEGRVVGSVVGRSDAEAAVFALSRLRRATMAPADEPALA